MFQCYLALIVVGHLFVVCLLPIHVVKVLLASSWHEWGFIFANSSCFKSKAQLTSTFPKILADLASPQVELKKLQGWS